MAPHHLTNKRHCIGSGLVQGDELVRITRRKGKTPPPQQGEAAAAAANKEDGEGEFETEFLCAVRFAPLKNRPSSGAVQAAMGTAAGPAAAALAAAAAAATPGVRA